jgi:tetratricopeptide (TPR) repeat protein
MKTNPPARRNPINRKPTPKHTQPARHAEPSAESAEQAMAHFREGTRLLQEGKPALALPLLEQARLAFPDSVLAAINLGGALILLGRHHEAVAHLEWASRHEPDNPMIWLNLGAAYLGNPILAAPGQQECALAAFQRAVDIDPATPSACYNMGLIECDRKNWERAESHFRAAVAAHPDDRDAANLLRRTQERMSDKEGQEG